VASQSGAAVEHPMEISSLDIWRGTSPIIISHDMSPDLSSFPLQNVVYDDFIADFSGAKFNASAWVKCGRSLLRPGDGVYPPIIFAVVAHAR